MRISWGGGTNESWSGSIRASGGKITDIQSLALNPDSPGGIRLVDTGAVIRQPSPTNYGGADVTIEGTADTVLQVELFPSDRPDQKFQKSVPFDQLLGGPNVEDIDDHNNRLTIARAPGDQIRVKLEQDSLIFAPNELMSLGIKPSLTGINARTANCRVKIVPAKKTSPTIWSHSFQFALDSTGGGRNERLEIPVPGTEGVYDLLIDLEPNWYQVPFNSKKQSLRRHVQFVVLEATSPDQRTGHSTAIPWQQSDLIDVSTGRSIARKPGASRQPFNRFIAPAQVTLGNDKRQIVELEQQKMLQLDVGGWHAIPLTVESLNVPYVVEIEYFACQPMAIGTSIIQPDSTGQIPSIGFDSGVAVTDSIVDDCSELSIKKHKIVFWPSVKRPLLLIANRHETKPAFVGNIRVLNGPNRLSANTTVASKKPTRNFMAFYEMPLFHENFGAEKTIDPSIEQPLDDWFTFYKGADRLIQYLKANSYRGAFVTVVSDGSAIYPSQYLDATPKYDSGVFFYNGQDPMRKDVLEMLFRMFDREGLKLVPTLAMSSPLPEIEALRDPDRGVQDFDLVNFRDQPRSANRSGLPIYNPLNVLVQKAVTNIVGEIAKRYREHPSFDSIAITCRPDTYTQLTGQAWGYDESTVRRFIASLNEQTENSNTNSSELLTAHKNEWLQWRARQMSGWYLQMLETIQRHVEGGKLCLAPADFYRNEEISSALSPSLHLSANYEEVLRRMGFGKELLTIHPDLVFLQPRRTAPSQSLASRRVETQLENSSQSKPFFQARLYPGTVISNRMSWAHFAELQEQSPFGRQSAPLMRLQQLSPSDFRNRELFANSLKDFDSRLLVSGGMILPTGQQDSLTEFMNVFGKLPDSKFEDIKSSQHKATDSPIAIRQFTDGNHWYFYAVNSSPWPVKATLSFNRAPTQSITSLSDTGLRQIEDGAYKVGLELEPFGLLGGTAADELLSINDFKIELPENADQALRSHLRKLRSKLAKASKEIPLEVLVNTDFSPAGQPTLDSWNFGEQPATNVKLDPNAGRNESASLLLTSDGKTVWIRSSQFAAPTTGRLTVSVWLKTDDPEQQPPLRLAIEGRAENSDYYRFGSIGALVPGSNGKQVTSQWQRFAVHFDDLPVQGIENLRIGFDLMGAGKVWIDDIEIYDRWFDGNDTKAITQMLASASLLLSNPESIDACRRILNSYWPRFLDEHFPDTEPLEEKSSETETPASPPLASPNSTIQSPGKSEPRTVDREKRLIPDVSSRRR